MSDADERDDVPLAEYREQVDRLVAKVLSFRRVLRAWLDRTDIRVRWPCPDCHRASKDAPVCGLTITRDDGTSYYTACWLCNTEDLRDRSKKELEG